MKHNIEELITYINSEISNIEYPQQAKTLFDPIKYILSLGGKRMRPLLSLLAVEMFGGKNEDVIYPALGLEIFHNFTLLHDDLMDKAVKRRGNDTVHIKWDDNTAILSGDAMQIIAYQFVAKADKKILPEILNVFSNTALEICEGQQYDMEFEKRSDVTEEEYLEMIRLKTAVLLGCALKFGAIAAGASPEDADHIYTFGENIGMGFQLKDDLLDVYADTAVFGKNIGGDILNDKKTFLLISALNLATKEDKEKMNKIFTGDIALTAESKINLFTRIYNESGAKDLCEEKIGFYYDKAFAALDEISIDTSSKTLLKEYVLDLMGREK